MRVLGDFENSIACLRGQMTQLPADNKHAIYISKEYGM